MCFSNMILAPLTRAPVEGPTFSDKPVECPADFLHRSLIIISMAIHYINIVKAKIFEGVSHAFDDMFP